MTAPRTECAVCGHPLGHIDEACPKCLPNFYRKPRLFEEPPPKAEQMDMLK